MHGPYPGELRVRVIRFVEVEKFTDVKRPNSSTSASVPRSDGCNAFVGVTSDEVWNTYVAMTLP